MSFLPHPIRNFRDFRSLDGRYGHAHWLVQHNRGAFLPPWGKVEQWLISVQHTDADVDRFVANFAHLADELFGAWSPDPLRASTTHAVAACSNGGSGRSARQRSASSVRVASSKRRDVRPGGPDAEQVRRPPLVERRERDADGQRRRADVDQPGLLGELGEVTLAAPGRCPSPRGRRSRPARTASQKTESGPVGPGAVPDARRHRAARPGDPPHLAQPGDRVGHEVDDQLGQGRVEGVVVVRELLRGPLAYVEPRGTAPEPRRRTTATGRRPPPRRATAVDEGLRSARPGRSPRRARGHPGRRRPGRRTARRVARSTDP